MRHGVRRMPETSERERTGGAGWKAAEWSERGGFWRVWDCRREICTICPARRSDSPDGGQWRVEIPSVEGPNALRAVFESADELGVPVHRVSQGSGVMLLTDDELDEMREIAAERGHRGQPLRRAARRLGYRRHGLHHGRPDRRPQGAGRRSAGAGGRGRAPRLRARHRKRAGDGRRLARSAGRDEARRRAARRASFSRARSCWERPTRSRCGTWSGSA